MTEPYERSVRSSYYADTINPFASPTEDRTCEWGVFRIGENEPVARGLTRDEAQTRCDELSSAS